MAATLTRLNPSALPDTRPTGYSQISITEPGRLAFVSGQVAWRSTGESPPASLSEQTSIVINNARAALDALKATPQDLVIVKLYVIDLTPERIAEAMPQIIAFFEGAQPSLTGVGVVSLAAPALQLEMEMIVRLPT
jgi:enamine deaminase RidA (YjgF/YER057c/UK114 family)